ncbi:MULTISPECIES: histone deacetylase family protein [unclassified Burkholderia]|uniref:histone deacetylase family protein n=1 Tax=unclassified Burkholderia TaxID=2613784 RepID=UPI000F58DB6D|nr:MULTISPECIES: histone deacetylase family protein [unclassified Burkholderia]RQS26458.1 histone deacetylase family protein [Burkholderia sp. Bp8995]RQS48436.1 histone deacetylase family protein [Burkholderia sp. Bp8989]
MNVYYCDTQREHNPSSFVVHGREIPFTEHPERASVLHAAALEAGAVSVVPDDFGLASLEPVHSPRYIAFLREGLDAWRQATGVTGPMVPSFHPFGEGGVYPDSIVGRCGFHVADTTSPISDGSWHAILRSAHAAHHAALSVAEGERVAYALCRPPGHHAERERAGGFCYVNNAGVAVERLRARFGRIVIVDVDVHHGNGQQSLYYSDPDVLTVSLHVDPVLAYPFFSGAAHECGTGRAIGCNLNVPMPKGTGDDSYLLALNDALQQVRAFGAGALVVALGLDASAHDPFAYFQISARGFGRIGAALADLELPTVLVQEGGYLAPDLGDNLRHFLRAWR